MIDEKKKKQENWKEILTSISKKAQETKSQVKKEHFIKIALHITTFIVITFCLLLLIFAITPLSNGVIKPILQPLYAFIEDEKGLDTFGNLKGTWTLIQTETPVDSNWLYVLNSNSSNIISSLALIGGSGWICFLTYLSIAKNIITPQFLKKTVRRGIQFGYVKQKDADYIIDEVDYSTGKKVREKVKDEEKELV